MSNLYNQTEIRTSVIYPSPTVHDRTPGPNIHSASPRLQDNPQDNPHYDLEDERQPVESVLAPHYRVAMMTINLLV